MDDVVGSSSRGVPELMKNVSVLWEDAVTVIRARTSYVTYP